MAKTSKRSIREFRNGLREVAAALELDAAMSPTAEAMKPVSSNAIEWSSFRADAAQAGKRGLSLMVAAPRTAPH